MDAEKDDPRMIPRKDPRASPLGRGADPGTVGEGVSRGHQGPHGLHGANVPHEKGGDDGTLHRENEDADARTR